MKNKHRTIGNIFLITGSVLIGGAVILIVTNMVLSNNLKKETGMIVGDIKAEISQRTADDPVNDTDGSRSPALYDSELEVAVIDDCPYDGYLTVPAIELEMAVFDTWNDDYLRKSACRYYGSPYTDDLVIAGHNYKSGFGKLKKLSPGDKVFFTDMNGRVTRYIVEVIEVLDGTAVEEMITGDWDLSLYTCTYGGKSRLTVRCRKA